MFIGQIKFMSEDFFRENTKKKKKEVIVAGDEREKNLN